MLAGTVTNRPVYSEREASWRRNPLEIYKCPYALLRRGFDPSEVVLCVRDPRDIVTSNTHGEHPGEYTIGWDRGEGWALNPLSELWQAMLPYLAPKRGRGAYLVRYEDLTKSPNDVQADIGRTLGLEYNALQWEHWPLGYRYPEYWDKSVGQRRKLKPRKHRDPQRLEQQLKHAGFRECCNVLGYT
jgi:hypothetical protein